MWGFHDSENRISSSAQGYGKEDIWDPICQGLFRRNVTQITRTFQDDGSV